MALGIAVIPGGQAVAPVRIAAEDAACVAIPYSLLGVSAFRNEYSGLAYG